MEMLRDKIKGLERKIIEMIRHGQDNVAIADKLHRWTRALMLTANAADLPDVLVRELHAPVPDPAGGDPRLGRAPRRSPALPFAQPRRRRRRRASPTSLAAPYCGVNSGFEAVQWLDDPARRSRSR